MQFFLTITKYKITRCWQIGNMTPSEAALGFPQSTLSTHTEVRISIDLKNLARPGNKLVVNCQYPLCSSCKKGD